MVTTELTTKQREMLEMFNDNDNVICKDNYRPMKALQRHGFISVGLTDGDDAICSLMQSGELWLKKNSKGVS